MKELSDRIAYVISQYDGTQVDLANTIGITKSAVGQWKNGHIKNIRPDNLFSLAKRSEERRVGKEGRSRGSPEH